MAADTNQTIWQMADQPPDHLISWSSLATYQWAISNNQSDDTEFKLGTSKKIIKMEDIKQSLNILIFQPIIQPKKNITTEKKDEMFNKKNI